MRIQLVAEACAVWVEVADFASRQCGTEVLSERRLSGERKVTTDRRLSWTSGLR
ncbi:hypothetical protein ACSS6W_006202 [Trichoderma asperelloides]